MHRVDSGVRRDRVLQLIGYTIMVIAILVLIGVL